MSEQRFSLKQLPRNVWAATLTSFFTDISSEMLVHLLPLFLMQVMGAKTAAIGLIEGLAETTASLLKIFSGWISDRLQTRKWPTVLGYGISALSKPFFLLVRTWPGVLVVRLADRIGKGIRTAPRDALIADSIDPGHRGLAFGLHRAGDTGGALVGTLGAALILTLSHQGATLTLDAFRRIVWWSLLPAFLAVLVLALGAQEVPVKAQREAPRLTLAGFDRRFKLFLLTVVIFTLGNSSDAFLILRAQERGLSPVAILLMVAGFNLIYTLASGPAGALSDRLGRRRLLIGGWIIYALIYGGFALARTGWHIALLYALYGLYYAANEGIAKALIADLVKVEQRGTAYGVYNAAIGLAALPASFIAGLLWQTIAPAAPFVFGAGLALLAALAVSRILGKGPIHALSD